MISNFFAKSDLLGQQPFPQQLSIFFRFQGMELTLTSTDETSLSEELERLASNISAVSKSTFVFSNSILS